MTDKEFKRLSRPQLIDIIYQFQLQVDKLTEQNKMLERELADKRLRINKTGNIAEAALEIHNVMQAAQDAAAHYLEEIRIMREETEENCRCLLKKAQKDADDIIAQAQRGNPSYNSELEEIMKEFGQKQQSDR